MEEKTNIFALTKQDTAVLKGIAIIAMLMHHLWGCPPEWVEPYTGVLGFFGNVGKVCVAIFLFCSGYGLSVGYQHLIEDCRLNIEDYRLNIEDCRLKILVKETLKFLAKRFVKFYAGYWPIFLIFVPIGVLVFGVPLSEAYGEHVNIFKRLLIDVLGLQGYSSYNITWWFNKLIILLYVLFPILYWGVKKGSWFFVGISCVGMLFYDSIRDVSGCDLLFWQFPFVLGMCWREKENLLQNIRVCGPYAKMILIVFSLAVTLLVMLVRQGVIGSYPQNHNILFWDPLLTLAVVLCVVLCRAYIPKVRTAFSFLGKHSMNIYMFHTLFLHWFSRWLYGCELGGGMNIIAILIVCVYASMVIEWMKERSKWNKLGIFVVEKIDKI